MIKKNRIMFSIFFCLIIALCFSFGAINTKGIRKTFADSTTVDSIDLGVFDFESGKFKDATGTEYNTYKSITVALASYFAGNEDIILPEVDGFILNENLSTTYSKVVNILTEKTAKTISEEYISKIEFINCNEQTISIILNKEEQINKVAYFSNNNHFYMYVKYAGGDVNTSWLDAYNSAKNMTYMGRQGYLATITNVQEDIFISKITGNEVGWLGGTILPKPEKVGNYYNYDAGGYVLPAITVENEEAKTEDYEAFWYWACGPECGDKFFNKQSIYYNYEQARHDSNYLIVYDNQQADYQENADAGYYFNWNCIYTYGTQLHENEPNEQGLKVESCLTTLDIGRGNSTGEMLEYNYSWNNITYDNGGGGYSAKGYIVEFGDLIDGDTHTSPESTDYVLKIVNLHNHTEGNWIEWTTATSLPIEAGNYYLGCDVTLSSDWSVPVGGLTSFCLNGHILNENGKTININSDTTLNLFDCDDIESHNYNGYVDSNGLWHFDNSRTDKIISGGIITGGNTGIKVNGTLNILGGTIAGNTNSGIVVSSIGKCTIFGGNIEFNTATNGGGINNSGDLSVFGGFIKNNTATNGGGIYQGGDTNIVLGGISAKILDNKDKLGNASNLYLTKEKSITIATGAKAPIMYEEYGDEFDENDLEVGVSLASGAGIVLDAGEDFNKLLKHFSNDDTNYNVIASFNDDGDKYFLNLVKVYNIENNMPYDNFETNNGSILILDMIDFNEISNAQSGSTVVIAIEENEDYMLVPGSLKVNDGEVPVVLLDEVYKFYTFVMPDEEVTITAEFDEISKFSEMAENEITSFSIEDWSYGEEPKIPVIEAAYGTDTVIYMFFSYSLGVYTTTFPTDAGSYVMIAYIPGTNEYEEALSDFEFSILKGTNEIADLVLNDWHAGSTPNTPTATAKYGQDSIVYTYSTEENGEYTSTVPTAEGNYFVKAEVIGNDNYTDAVLTASFSILEELDNQNEITLKMEGYEFGKTPNVPSYEGILLENPTITYYYSTTNSIDGGIEWKNITGTSLEAGTYYMYAVVGETEHYKGFTTDIISFVIAEEETGVRYISLWWLIVLLSIINCILILWLIKMLSKNKEKDKDKKQNNTKLMSAIPSLFIPWQVHLCLCLGIIAIVLMVFDIFVAVHLKNVSNANKNNENQKTMPQQKAKEQLTSKTQNDKKN